MYQSWSLTSWLPLKLSAESRRLRSGPEKRVGWLHFLRLVVSQWEHESVLCILIYFLSFFFFLFFSFFIRNIPLGIWWGRRGVFGWSRSDHDRDSTANDFFSSDTRCVLAIGSRTCLSIVLQMAQVCGWLLLLFCSILARKFHLSKFKLWLTDGWTHLLQRSANASKNPRKTDFEIDLSGIFPLLVSRDRWG